METLCQDGTRMTGSGSFALTLREMRDRVRLSQSRLAERAGFDHSYVSRLESGSRMPTREAVTKLAEAMHLSDGDRDALLASAGFMPGRIENLFASEPVLSEVLTPGHEGVTFSEPGALATLLTALATADLSSVPQFVAARQWLTQHPAERWLDHWRASAVAAVGT